jgi:hypothetical protein
MRAVGVGYIVGSAERIEAAAALDRVSGISANN